MHNNMLTIDGQKMSKSAGNFITLNEFFTGNHNLLEQAYSPMTIRFFMLQAHYRSTLDFSNSALQAAEKGLKKLVEASKTLNKLSYQKGSEDSELESKASKLIDQCFEYMSDDFNTAKVIAVLFEMTSIINEMYQGRIKTGSLSTEIFENFKFTFNSFIFNILGLQGEDSNGNNEVIDGIMNTIISIRKTAREEKNWTLSDQIRDELKKAGIQIKDEKDGKVSYSFE